MGFERLELLVSDPGRPAAAHVVEQGAADGHQLVASGGDPHALAACVARVGLAVDVAEPLQDGDGLRGGLLGDRQPAAELGGGVRARVHGAQGELVHRADAVVAALRELDVHLVDHRVEPAEQQKRELGAAGLRHAADHTRPAEMDKLLVYPLRFDK